MVLKRAMALKRELILPTLILGPADVNRTLLEMHALDEYLHQESLRKDTNVKLPKTSRTLDSLAASNGADLLQPTDRERLVIFLQSLQQRAPVLHISFAAEPSAAFTAQIVTWMRENIAQYVLVQVGLQPSIAAGCIIRSTNKVFDMSLRRHLQQKRSFIADLMHSIKDEVRDESKDELGKDKAEDTAPALSVVEAQR